PAKSAATAAPTRWHDTSAILGSQPARFIGTSTSSACRRPSGNGGIGRQLRPNAGTRELPLCRFRSTSQARAESLAWPNGTENQEQGAENEHEERRMPSFALGTSE